MISPSAVRPCWHGRRKNSVHGGCHLLDILQALMEARVQASEFVWMET